MNRYLVTYTDNGWGDRIISAEVDAEDEADALDTAMFDDYNFGTFIATELLEEDIEVDGDVV